MSEKTQTEIIYEKYLEHYKLAGSYDTLTKAVQAFKLRKRKKVPFDEEAFEGVKSLLRKVRREMEKLGKSESVWLNWLQYVRGISPVMVVRLIAALGYCENMRTIGAVYKRMGQHVVHGKAPRKLRGKKLEWDPRKAQLAYQIGECLVRGRGMYYQLYRWARDVKYRDYPAKSKKHLHQMVMRYMRKKFLAHYFITCKKILGVPIDTAELIKMHIHWPPLRDDKPAAIEKLYKPSCGDIFGE